MKKGLFTCVKEKHERENYLSLRNMEIKNALSKLTKMPCLLLNLLLSLMAKNKKGRKDMQIL